MRKEEIKPADLAIYGLELQDAVEAICKSPHFNTSPKSCEFLRHIVGHTIRGDRDELKERLIGIALLGRTVDYDTGSDAGVRVRANDVRKRLNAYRAASEPAEEFMIELPAGSYIPRFFRSFAPLAEAPPCAEDSRVESQPHNSPPPLPLQALALPTLVALFLCIVCIRWQLAQEHPFTTFWQSALQDRHAFLYLPSSENGLSRELISRERLEAAAPLLNLAGQFHAQLTLTRAPEATLSSNDVLVTIGPTSGAETQNGPRVSSQAASPMRDRILVEDTRQGRRIVDFGDSGIASTIAGRAALLTISNGARRVIQIDGTDDAAISAMVKQLCERDTFPEDLTYSFQAGTITQAVFPLSAEAGVRVLHEPLPESTSASLRQ